LLCRAVCGFLLLLKILYGRVLFVLLGGTPGDGLIGPIAAPALIAPDLMITGRGVWLLSAWMCALLLALGYPIGILSGRTFFRHGSVASGLVLGDSCPQRVGRRLSSPADEGWQMLYEQVRLGKKAARRTVEWGQRHVVRPVWWGNLRRREPFSDWYGSERGRPVDRLYIDGFIERHRADLIGHVMEIKNPHYVDLYARAEKVTVVDIDRANPNATLYADLDEVGSLPAGVFDAAIVTNTLQYLEPQPALANLWQSLAPGGVLLLAAPTLARVDAEIPDIDYLRFTPRGLRREFVKAGIPAVVEGYGNILASLCTLYGLSIQDVSVKELDRVDPRFPITVCARAVKTAS